MNFEEVSNLQDVFLDILKENKTKINGYDLLKYIGFPISDFSRQIFAIYEDNLLTWNEYFQFIMMMCTSSPEQLIKLSFKLAHVKDSNNLTLEDLTSFLNLFNKADIYKGRFEDLFRRFDANKNGTLSFKEFYQIIETYPATIEAIINIRLAIHSATLGIGWWRIIMKRFYYIEEIKEYQKSNNGELIPEFFWDKFLRKMSGRPHPYKYDYQCGDREVYDIIDYIETIRNKYLNTSFVTPLTVDKNIIWKRLLHLNKRNESSTSSVAVDPDLRIISSPKSVDSSPKKIISNKQVENEDEKEKEKDKTPQLEVPTE